MREKGPTKIKIKAIDPQKIFALQNILIVLRAYESLNPGLTKTDKMNRVQLKPQGQFFASCHKLDYPDNKYAS
jgi:hypothetical protein